MPSVILQIPSIILPDVSGQNTILGTEVETINDLLVHTSIEFPAELLQEKDIHIVATEVAGLRATGVIVGGPFTVGEAVVGVPSGAIGIVRAQGGNWIDIVNVVGAFIAGDTIAGAVSGAIINGGLAIVIAVPGNLWCWVELSPYPSANTTGPDSYWPDPYPISTAYWVAIGGGGGVNWATLGLLPPIIPHIEVSGLAGLAGILSHPINLPWTIHSPWVRLVVQTPVAAGLPNAYWLLQCLISAKTP